MDYKEFLTHIYSKYSGNVKLGLERMQGLLNELDNPQNSLHGFHIAGTNGKGSVCAGLEALCLSRGSGVGLNTSPHLINYTERFRIDGRELDFASILSCFSRHEKLFEKWDASFFEITTAIAFIIFSQNRLRDSIIEVGLGGRLDATNLWTPDICAITTIGLDHVKTLGGTKELIAAEKAGIIKPEIPLVLGAITGKPLEIILEIAAARHAPVYLYDRDFVVENIRLTPDGTYWDFRGLGYELRELHTNMLGLHQPHNLSLSLACFLLNSARAMQGVDEGMIRQALVRVNWQGRMQVISQEPRVILDGAHNVQGVEALIAALEELYPGRRLKFILSILADKNYSEMIRLICDKAELIYVAQNESDRAASVEDQMKMVQKHGVNCVSCPSVAAAYRQALAEAEKADVIIAGGSLYTVGEILSEKNR